MGTPEAGTAPAGGERITSSYLDSLAARALIFRVAGHSYACDVTAVREVVPLGRVTPIPGAPDAVVGLVNLRGTIVTVIDGGMCLHAVPTDRAHATMLLVDAGPRGVGFTVDAVTDVRPMRAGAGVDDVPQLDVRAAVVQLVEISEER